jgi:hypothetical protein
MRKTLERLLGHVLDYIVLGKKKLPEFFYNCAIKNIGALKICLSQSIVLPSFFYAFKTLINLSTLMTKHAPINI